MAIDQAGKVSGKVEGAFEAFAVRRVGDDSSRSGVLEVGEGGNFEGDVDTGFAGGGAGELQSAVGGVAAEDGRDGLADGAASVVAEIVHGLSGRVVEVCPAFEAETFAGETGGGVFRPQGGFDGK